MRVYVYKMNLKCKATGVFTLFGHLSLALEVL